MRPCLLVAVVLLSLTVSPGRAEPTVYTIVPSRSQVGFDAAYPLGDFSGSSDDVAGEFTLDPANLGVGAVGSVTVNPATLKTGLSGRDRDLRTAMAVEKYPEIRFTLGAVQASFPSLAERPDTALTITGTLIIHGVARPATLTGRARIVEGRLWVRGEGALKMTDFGITPPRKFFLSVKDEVRVSFDVLLAPRE
ncbi:MAG: YceI family protein [Candidatus Rokubacteria bacterium]|nr:YceI family protein [Candidatus Rokubacteria bacterium]